MIKQFYKSNIRSTFTVILMALVGGACVAYGSYVLTPATNALRRLETNQFLILIVATMIFSSLGRVLQYFAGYVFSKQEQAYFHDLRKKTINNYYKDKPVPKVSNMQNRLTNDLNLIDRQSLNPVFNILLSLVDLIFSAYVVLTFNFWLLCLILVLAMVMLYLPRVLTKQLEKATNQVSSSYDNYIDTIEKWLSGLYVLQMYRSKSKLLSVLSHSSTQLENANVTRDKRYTQLESLSHCANMIAQSLVLLVTGYLILTHQLSFGAIMSIGNFSSLIFSQLVVITSQWGSVRSTSSLSKDIMKSAEERPEVDNKLDNLTDFGTLSTQNLALKYANGEEIKYPNIEVKAGEKILLTGDSGTGKSTLFKMILDEIKPTQGKITFKNKEGKVINPDYSRIGYIPQDPVVFPGTIEDNITMFDDDLDNKAADWANKMQLATDLEKFPEGIKTEVDLDKNNLSGGQRQKIILARTEVYNSKIILIDEGTSAIDSIATEHILANILKGPETVIFIAHNLTDKMSKMFDRRIHLSNENK